MVVEAGLAVTLEPVELLREEDGVQVYVDAPLAVNATGEPLQIDVLGETVTLTVVTVTVACAVDVQPFASVPVTVYVVVEDGLAVTDEPVDELRFVDGLQVYVCAPLALSVVDWPLQIVGELTEITGGGFTVTVTCAVAVHPLDVPVTV